MTSPIKLTLVFLRGHNYMLLAKVYRQSGQWLDFEDIKRKVDQFIDERYAHHDLGNMRCERLAKELQDHLSNSSRRQ